MKHVRTPERGDLVSAIYPHSIRSDTSVSRFSRRRDDGMLKGLAC